MLRKLVTQRDVEKALPEGARSVGTLEELDEPMQVFVLYLRRWIESLEGREGVWHDARERFGSHAKPLVSAFEKFLGVVAAHATRPLQRHGRHCRCVGADEAALVAIIQAAGRRDATLLRLLTLQFVEDDGFLPVVTAALHLHDCLAIGAAPVMNQPSHMLH